MSREANTERAVRRTPRGATALALASRGAGDPLRPDRLAAGDCVAVVATSGAVERRELEHGVRVLASFGYRVRVAPEAYRRNHYFAGPDEVRAASLRAALLDPEVKAIFLARGGYGAARLLPLLDPVPGGIRPKIVVGYSDATALLSWLTGRYGWITFHGPMVSTDFPTLSATDARILRDLVEGRAVPAYRLGAAIAPGRAEGRLAGGNLSTLVSLLGTPWAPRLAGTVLFLEDRNERPYRIDRMLTQLRLGGMLDGLEGMVLGEMPDCGDARELRRIVRDVTGDRPFPIATGLRSGHGRGKRTLPFGARVRVDTESRHLEILEPVVA